MQNLGVLATKISILEILCSVLLFVCCKDGLYEYLLDVTLINLCCPARCKVFLLPSLHHRTASKTETTGPIKCLIMSRRKLKMIMYKYYLQDLKKNGAKMKKSSYCKKKRRRKEWN